MPLPDPSLVVDWRAGVRETIATKRNATVLIWDPMSDFTVPFPYDAATGEGGEKVYTGGWTGAARIQQLRATENRASNEFSTKTTYHVDVDDLALDAVDETTPLPDIRQGFKVKVLAIARPETDTPMHLVGRVLQVIDDPESSWGVQCSMTTQIENG